MGEETERLGERKARERGKEKDIDNGGRGGSGDWGFRVTEFSEACPPAMPSICLRMFRKPSQPFFKKKDDSPPQMQLPTLPGSSRHCASRLRPGPEEPLEAHTHTDSYTGEPAGV